ncbi:hypothetical protein Afil01_66470 [Actinorhabdospora filicis]|uniref:Uncharacterized protein n=1 Tax=Actinorhabdospora filicis TaxID=1785913 RepID=A0A9W6STU9_9ACTN|nr:hypothetical protein [Actinorhabdospora filicis]GLZ81840.1 hypothetical protein Afil01_66470 [Actinorhabdospora filicis]
MSDPNSPYQQQPPPQGYRPPYPPQQPEAEQPEEPRTQSGRASVPGLIQPPGAVPPPSTGRASAAVYGSARPPQPDSPTQPPTPYPQSPRTSATVYGSARPVAPDAPTGATPPPANPNPPTSPGRASVPALRPDPLPGTLSGRMDALTPQGHPQPPAYQPPPAPPVSAPPTPLPVSAPPMMSPAPVSAPPVSAPPVSAPPVSGPPVSGPPVSGPPSSQFSPGIFGPKSAGRSGTVYGGQGPSTVADEADAGPDGRTIDALGAGRHIATPRALELLATPAPPAGLVIGRDAERKPVVMPLFRPEPTRAALVGGLWAAKVVVFRALALGARVAVCTVRPREWEGLGRAATGRDDRLAVLAGDRPVTVDANPHSPALYVYDVGDHGTATTPVLGPWRTQLTVLPRLTVYGSQAVEDAHLTILQRLHPDEAPAASTSLRVSSDNLRLLQMMYDDMVAVVRDGVPERFVWCTPTSHETRLFGNPHRGY